MVRFQVGVMESVGATLVSIGDELLIGQVVDSNSAWIGAELTRLGITVVRKVTVGDDVATIADEVREAWSNSRIVVCTGGLGPTDDDVTTQAIADAFGATLETDAETLSRIRKRFQRRGVPMARSNERQARVPQGFEVLQNAVGTAPAFAREEDGRFLFVLPGVPLEMKTFMQRDVLPRLTRMPGLPALHQKTLLTAGIAESELQDMLSGLEEDITRGISIAWLPSTLGVRIRVMSRAEDGLEAGNRLDRMIASICERIGDYVYGQDHQSLEEVVGRMLRERGLSLAVAESGTGGLVGSRITDVPGASDYFKGGAVVYSNQAKVEVLGVESTTLAEHGAVSRQVAVQMASGVRKRFGADVGLSTTGIMGPGGATPGKPVGTVWVGLSVKGPQRDSFESAVLLNLGSDRIANKERTATAALNAVRKVLNRLQEGVSGASMDM